MLCLYEMNILEQGILNNLDPLQPNLAEQNGFLIPENLPPNADRALYTAKYIREAIEKQLRSSYSAFPVAKVIFT